MIQRTYLIRSSAILFIIFSFVLFFSCTKKRSEVLITQDTLPDSVCNVSDGFLVDSIMSEDGRLKIYTWQMIGPEYTSRSCQCVIAFRGGDGRTYYDRRSLLDIAKNDSYNIHLPVDCIYQGCNHGDTIYLIQLDSYGSSSRNNSVFVSIGIKDNSIVPAPVIRHNSSSTCLISNEMQ